jgi:hypothetical protein
VSAKEAIPDGFFRAASMAGNLEHVFRESRPWVAVCGYEPRPGAWMTRKMTFLDDCPRCRAYLAQPAGAAP